ncbi:MAG: dihydrodipicolinate synthase family protein [Pirellulales bacterium]|nr:dihydrodipicolinate synthase family protein [Pirellulales bacterium]
MPATTTEQKLRGIFTPNLVPLDENGEIHETELRRYTDWLIERGVHGLYPNGSTGEFPRFTAEERQRIIQIVCDQAQGRVPVLAGAAEANTRETLRACEKYQEYGARAVAIVAPFYYKLGPEAVYAYFREIAQNSPIDVTLYNIPMFASPIDVATIQRLAELPKIVGIKDSTGDFSLMQRMMRAVRPIRPDFVFLTGWDAALVPMLLGGCQGGTHASSGVVPELTRQIFDYTQQGKNDLAWKLQAVLAELFDKMLLNVEFPEGFRLGVEIRGFRMGRGRQPQTTIQAAQLKELRGQLEQILAESLTTLPTDYTNRK